MHLWQNPLFLASIRWMSVRNSINILVWNSRKSTGVCQMVCSTYFGGQKSELGIMSLCKRRRVHCCWITFVSDTKKQAKWVISSFMYSFYWLQIHVVAMSDCILRCCWGFFYFFLWLFFQKWLLLSIDSPVRIWISSSLSLAGIPNLFFCVFVAHSSCRRCEEL